MIATTQFDKELMVMQRALVQDPYLAYSLRLSSGRVMDYYTDDAREMQAQAYDRAKECQLEAFDERDVFETETRDYFLNLVERENNNIDFFNSHQWSDKEIKQIRGSDLIPHKSNTQRRWGMTLLGEQRGSRTRFKAFGRDPVAQEKAEAENYYLQWAAQITKWNKKNSTVFRDGVIGGRGVAEIGLDPYDPLGKPFAGRCRPQEFMFDPENAQDGSLAGSNYLWRGYLASIEDLIWKYPLFEKELRQQASFNLTRSHKFFFTLNNPKVHPTSERASVPYKWGGNRFLGKRKRLWVVEFYRRRYKPVISVYDSIANVDHDFDTIQEASYFYRYLSGAYMFALAAAGDDPNTPVVAEPRRVGRCVVDQMVFAGTRLVSVQTNEGDSFPYHHFIPEFWDGEITGYFEHDKDNQKLRNRMLIFFELLMSGVKGKTAYDEKILPAGVTPEMFEEWLVRPTKALGLKLRAGQRLQDLLHHFDPPNHGSLPQIMMQYARDDENQALGGLSAIGVPDYAGQSGSAIKKLQAKSGAALIPLFDEFEFFEQESGASFSYIGQFINPVRLMATIDDRNKVNYRRFIDDGIQSMENMEYDIFIDEVEAGPSERENQYNLLLSQVQNAPGLLEDAFPELAELAGVDKSRITRIEERSAKRHEFEQRIAAEEVAINRAEKEHQASLREREQTRKEHETLRDDNPPIKTTASIKMQAGPAMTTEVLNANGIEADVDMVAADQAVGRMMDVAEADLMHKTYNKNLLPEQREAMKNKASATGGGKKPSAKDSIARKNKR